MVTEKTIMTMKSIFNSYDKDGNGVLSTNELNRFFKSMNTYFTQRELNETMYLIDTTSDGVVSFPEFIQYMLEDD